MSCSGNWDYQDWLNELTNFRNDLRRIHMEYERNPNEISNYFNVAQDVKLRYTRAYRWAANEIANGNTRVRNIYNEINDELDFFDNL